MRLLWTFIAGGVAAFVLIGLVGLAIEHFGLFDTRASTPHDPLTAWATHSTMIHAVQRSTAGIAAPRAFTPEEITAGARDYARDCARCHGGPGVGRERWVLGMNPPPPYLVDAARHWRRAELFFLARNGVKMTGMPAWGPTRSDGELWDVVAFIEALPDLSAADYARMTAPAPPKPPASR